MNSINKEKSINFFGYFPKSNFRQIFSLQGVNLSFEDICYKSHAQHHLKIFRFSIIIYYFKEILLFNYQP